MEGKESNYFLEVVVYKDKFVHFYVFKKCTINA